MNEAPRGRRGIAKLRKVLIEGLDSHLERLMKKLVWSSSLPRPLVHHEVASRSGKGLTIDFGYPAERVAIETDGWAFHSDRDAFQRDREKWRELGKLGWTILCFTHEDVTCRPREVIETIAVALSNNAVTQHADRLDF